MVSKYPIVVGSVKNWWDNLSREEKSRYGGKQNATKNWEELPQFLRNSISILTLSLKGS